MEWWYWIILGAVLFGAEIFAIEAQFYLVFIGISAAIVGLLGWLGLDLAFWAQWALFGVLSLASMFSFRKALHSKVHGNTPGFREGLAGDHLILDNDIDAGQTDRVSFRGTKWTVINEGSATLKSGTRVLIERSEGLTLYVGTAA